MATNIWLTNEASDLSGYLLAKVGSRSDNPSLVRAVTATEAGPSAGVAITLTSGGTVQQWITPPLDGTGLTAAAWVLHLWASESNAAANAALRCQIFRFTNAEAGSALLDNNAGTELGTTIKDMAITTANASVTTMADGDRLVFKVLIDDATAVNMAAGYTVTFAFNGRDARAEGDSYVVAPDTLAVTAALPSATTTAIRRLLKDTDATNPFVTDTEIARAVTGALRTYSKDRPRLVVGALSGNGSTTAFVLPRLWIHGFSSIDEIEYPTGNLPRTVLETRDYEIVESVLGTQPTRLLTFLNAPESGTNNALVRYFTRHSHDDELDTVPLDDFDAFCWLAASYAAVEAAAKMAASSDSTIVADAVNYRDGVTHWRDIAKEYRKMYDDHIGGGIDIAVPPALAINEWDTNFAFGVDRLTHPRRWR